MYTRKIKEISKGIAEIKNAGKTVWRGDPFGDLPGPKKLIAGNYDAGFYGEVPVSELIRHDELANSVGLNEGTCVYPTGPWLKFSYKNKILFYPKKASMKHVTIEKLKSLNLINGDRKVLINGKRYKIRLIKGMVPDVIEGSYKKEFFIESEWNRLIMPLSINAKDQSFDYIFVHGGCQRDWSINYTNTDMDFRTGQNYIIDYVSFTQGILKGKTNEGSVIYYQITRGGSDAGDVWSSQPSHKANWRPILEPVK